MAGLAGIIAAVVAIAQLRYKDDDIFHLFKYEGTFVASHFSLADLTAFDVRREWADADKTVHFATFFRTDELLSKRVAERIEAGVEVHGVWDQLGEANSCLASKTARKSGARLARRTMRSWWRATL